MVPQFFLSTCNLIVNMAFWIFNREIYATAVVVGLGIIVQFIQAINLVQCMRNNKK